MGLSSAGGAEEVTPITQLLEAAANLIGSSLIQRPVAGSYIRARENCKSMLIKFWAKLNKDSEEYLGG
jgi:hypothetical protein